MTEAVDIPTASALEFTDRTPPPYQGQGFAAGEGDATLYPTTPSSQGVLLSSEEVSLMDPGSSVVDRTRDILGTRLPLDKGPYPAPTNQASSYLEDLDGLEEDTVTLLRRLKDGIVQGTDLTKEQRLGVVLALTDSGYTEDEQAAMLGLSRRTIVRDKARIREIHAQQAPALDENTLAGMVVHNCQVWMAKSVKDKMFRTASKIQKDMITLLQDLGLVYRAPVRQDIRSLSVNKTILASKGYQNMLNTIGNDKDRANMVLEDILAEMASQIES